MHHTVEVRHIGKDLAEATSKMRTWLDRNGIQASEFYYSIGGPGIAFRFSFAVESDAAAFAEAFDGRLNRGDDPLGKSLWGVNAGASPQPSGTVKPHQANRL